MAEARAAAFKNRLMQKADCLNEEDPDGGGSRLLQHRRVIMLLEGGGPQPPTPSGRPPDDDAISLPDAFDPQMPEDDVAELFGNFEEEEREKMPTRPLLKADCHTNRQHQANR